MAKKSDNKHSSRYPSIFVRVFLSHLLLLSATFLAGVFLFFYLFEPGIKYFLMHKPLVIFPMVMGLIGIAGILSAWTAGIIAEPLELLSFALADDDSAMSLHAQPFNPVTEEVALLAAEMRRYQDTILSQQRRQAMMTARQQHQSIITVTVSTTGIVLGTNAAAERLTGKSRRTMLYGDFLDLFAVPDGDAYNTLRNAVYSGTSVSALAAPAFDSQRMKRLIEWNSMPMYDVSGMQTGMVLFGRFTGRRLSSRTA